MRGDITTKAPSPSPSPRDPVVRDPDGTGRGRSHAHISGRTFCRKFWNVPGLIPPCPERHLAQCHAALQPRVQREASPSIERRNATRGRRGLMSRPIPTLFVSLME